MKLSNIRKIAAFVIGVTASSHAAQIDAINDNTLTEFDNALGVRVLKQSQTWTRNNIYILKDRLFIKNGQTLTIEPGTKVYGSVDSKNSPVRNDDAVGSIIATRGGRLVANGTSTEPIVFTAIQQLEADTNTDLNGDSIVGPAPTASQGGLWGGIVLLGNAYISQASAAIAAVSPSTLTTASNIGKAEIEGFLPAGTPDAVPVDGLADAITYGFDASYPRDDADDSGSLRYVSIRHGGYEFSAGREINGLTMGGVGSGTRIEFVEVYANTDDGFEWFGGTVSTKNLVSAFNQDDSFDFDSGHTGTHQFLFAVQNPGLADGGCELDGIESSPSSGANQTAGFNSGLTLSKPIFYNMTLIGPGSSNTKSTISANTGQVLTEKGNHALIIEDYFNGEFYNSVFHDFTQDLALFRDLANSTGATPAAAHNTVGSFGDATPGTNSSYILNTNSRALFYNSLAVAQNGNSEGGAAPGFRSYTRNSSPQGSFLTALDPRPASTSPLLQANGATLQPNAPVLTAFRGAFGADNWASAWTAISQSGVLQGDSSTPDTISPVISLIGSNPINLVIGNSFTDPGANLTDNRDAARVIFGAGSINTGAAGTYVLTYNATDAANNAAVTVTRTVNVSMAADVTPPVIALIGANPLNLSVGDTFLDPGANVTDNRDAARVISGTGNVNTGFAGTYTVTYNTSDAANNRAAAVTRTVVVAGRISPVATFTTTTGGRIDIANYFQSAQFSNAIVGVVGKLPAGLSFDPSKKLLRGYPSKVPTRASFTITTPGQAPIPFIMDFGFQPLTSNIIGAHVAQTSIGDHISISVDAKAVARVTISRPGAPRPINATGNISYDTNEANPSARWKLVIPAHNLRMTFPFARSFNQAESSYLGNYGQFEGKLLWGYKSTNSTGTIKLRRDNIEVIMSGVTDSKNNVNWTITPVGGRAIRASGSVSVDGIYSLSAGIPNVPILTGMLRVDEQLNSQGQPTGQLSVSILQGFRGWTPVEYIAP